MADTAEQEKAEKLAAAKKRVCKESYGHTGHVADLQASSSN